MILEEEVEPPQKKTKLSPLHHVLCQSSFSSLPEEIVVECLARISQSYYRSLSLVSKTFRSLISSQELYAARSQTGTTEIFLYICLRFSTKPLEEPTRRWFSVSVKPNRNQTDGGTKSKARSSENLLVPFYNSPPYSYPIVAVGSKIYIISGHMDYNSPPSSALWVYDCRSRTWGDVPNMEMKRKHASACVLDDKIYVMGGCEDIKWFEMYDIKTQTWKTLPKNPDTKVRTGDNVRKIDVVEGKIYVKTEDELKDWIYDVKEGKWSAAEEQLSLLWSNSWCVIENVMYCYTNCSRYKWYDLKARKWRDVKGLKKLKRYCSASNDSRNCLVELVNYGGKLAILWDRFQRPGRSQNKNIWCAMVALEKRCGGAVWGKVEWVNVVLTVPKSYSFLGCIALLV